MNKNLNKKYNHIEIEKDRYEQWVKSGLFKANVSSINPTFSIILPPPNVTGLLHLGHAWDSTIQDLLIRYKRLQGFNTLFIPGMDHAGIATQVKVAQRIKEEQKLNLQELGKDKFLQQAWKWKTEYAQNIRKQWAKLGLALDYSHEVFTLDENVKQAVNEVFVKLYKEGLVYRGKKIVNWDPELKTAISNIEVNYHETKGKMYYLKYFIENSSEFITIATTRPETMFADQCIVVNSKDKRYLQFIGKMVVNPANKMLIKVIADDYVDMNFGTGAMKCTPAHDANDYEIALRHNLAMPICMNVDGTMNELAQSYINQDRMVCRKQLVEQLRKENLVVKVEDHLHQVGYSERSNAIIEPYLSQQWFIKMKPLVEMIIDKQKNKKTKIDFHPILFEQQLLQWLNNIQDWCISRQLWWGHSLPVWYHKKTKKIYVDTNPPSPINDYIQESDVLDTWFSSGLWPFVTLGWPQKNVNLQKYYPISVLVTAYDILFFWVARMMFMGWKFTNQKPFTNVLIHGLIRDEQGRKMSKSLNNGIDPMEVIKKYGADALRYFLVSNCAPGQDLRFSITKVESTWNFNNKLWNAARYVLMNIDDKFQLDENIVYNNSLSFIDQWILQELNQLIIYVEQYMEKYEFVLVVKALSNFIWNKYCSWYIELNKVNLQNQEQQSNSLQTLYYVLQQIIIMVHPFIPFITEAIYEEMGYKNSILTNKFPKVKVMKKTKDVTQFVEILIEIIGNIREIRKELNLSLKLPLTIHINTTNSFFEVEKNTLNPYLLQLTNSQIVTISDSPLSVNNKIIKIINSAVIEINVSNLFNKEEQLAKLKEDLVYIENEIKRSKDILSNQQFLVKAPPIKVEIEKQKLEKYQNQKILINAKIKEL
ncbi:valine--tRNA ligase [Spiroplasma endosymbiont of Danaus chrysippus]|uniref:valine--tRNA ligase n=1 Tax=Spiroplasma endosymbiont of Danaus chrysippus TaxID=2691041 RepID=UPI00157AA887|nr:valine--tRNA ligase [Spiroplasma endosymbiont of Danaus chrysippus]